LRTEAYLKGLEEKGGDENYGDQGGVV